MGEWKSCTLSSLGTIVGGATPSTKKPENYEGGTIPWITPKDLSGFAGRYISHGERNITEKGLNSCSAQMMPKHSVLFSSRAPIGYVAISNCEVCTSSFIKAIKELRESADGTSTELYFRGQEVEFWDIEPSIFRNDMLSIEHKLMQIPLQKIPMEFKGFDSLFDVMTKYQHYGMCTRLLDLTTNPLVALYFACKIHGQEKYETEDDPVEQEPYGVVYYTNNYYPSQSVDKEVKIVTALASYDLSKENTIGTVLDKLRMDNLINEETKARWLKKEYVGEFIKIIQRNYMVVPTYTNERLQRQNGVFLLASMFSVNIGANVKDGVITKSKNNLRDEFASKYFYIKGENKESILKELDLYNINEATLFPELEHQLNYIRYANADFTQSVTEFSKYEDNHVVTKSDVYIDDGELNQYVIDVFHV